jgi:hypothetical protein
MFKNRNKTDESVLPKIIMQAGQYVHPNRKPETDSIAGVVFTYKTANDVNMLR